MKTALTGILTIALVSVLVGAGTFAFYADTETSTGNTFAAGTFDIELNSVNSLPFAARNIAPGWNHIETHGVTNVGSLAGEIYLTAENFGNPGAFYGGSYAEPPEPEPSIDVAYEDFAKVLYMLVEVDLINDWPGYKNFETEIYDGPLYGMETAHFPIGPEGDYIECQFTAYLPENLNDPLTVGDEDDNLYQADGVSADITFRGTTEITIE